MDRPSAKPNQLERKKPTERFSNRVENYVKYRPGYPAEIIDFLHRNCGLDARAIVADIGSGTGILAELFLRNGNQVLGVEPNPEMRVAGESFLARYRNFISVAATAEATTLADHSVDLSWRDKPFTGSIASGYASNLNASLGLMVGWCWCGTNV